jgi:hypothetical protein
VLESGGAGPVSSARSDSIAAKTMGFRVRGNDRSAAV